MTGGFAGRVWGSGGVRLALADAAILAVLAAAALATLALPGGAGRGAARAQLLGPGGFARSLDLSRDSVTPLHGPLGETRVEVRGGRVRVLSSPCPEQLCRRRGWAAGGPPIVCAPNGVVVRFGGDGARGVDATTR